VEDVNREYGSLVWFQRYITSRWDATERLVGRAEAAGCPVLAWTVDLLAGSNRETATRGRRADTRDCASCHGAEAPGALRRRPNFNGIDVTGLNLGNPNVTWDTIGKLKKLTKMKVVIKGIETREDAELCCQNGADGIIVSNHGGRADESGRATIECLPEVIEAVRGRVPVMVDGGIRRGSDAFKALALGARAVGIGRPYLWGLSAFGQPGVERVIDILRNELALTMRQCGTRSLAEIGRNSVIL
jgi:4-hydroxymandelate oxidase